MRDPNPGLVTTPGRAGVDRLPGMELAPGEGLAMMRRRLLHAPITAAADRADPRLLVDRDLRSVGAEQLLVALLAQGTEKRPYLRERFERQRTVFFTAMP